MDPKRQIPVDQLIRLIGSQQVEIALLRGDKDALRAQLEAATSKPTVKAAAGTIRPKAKRR